MLEQSEGRPSSDCGHIVGAGNSAVVVEPECEIVSFPDTQSANNSTAGGMSQGRLGKKSKPPKPIPKPNIVAKRVAEFTLQQQLNSNGSTMKPPLNRAGSCELPGPAPPRPPSAASAVDSSKSTQTRLSASDDGPQYENLFSSDDPFYDKAVRVKLDVLRRVSENMGSADVLEKSIPTSATTDSPASGAVAKPMYATPKKRVVVEEEEPIYEDANAFVSPVDEEPLYDEAIVVPLYDEANVVNSEGLRLANSTLEELGEGNAFLSPVDEEPLYDEAIIVPMYDKANVVHPEGLRLAELEPLYADPADLSHHRSHATSTTQYSEQDKDVYDEAQPVNRMAIPRGEVCN